MKGVCLQARILLEEAGTALTEAEGPGGLGPLSGTETGVYVGCMYQEYTDVLAAAGGKLSAATATGNSLSFLVGRVSYTFGLQVRTCRSSPAFWHAGLQGRQRRRTFLSGQSLTG